MIATLLRRVEQNPEAYFSEVDLGQFDPVMVASLKALRVLERLPIDTEVTGLTTTDGRVLQVVEDDDGSELIDPDDLEFEPTPLNADDLRRWRVNTRHLAELIQRVNQLTGEPESIGPRLVFIGADRDGAAVILALYPSWPAAKSEIEHLPEPMARAHRRFTVCSTALKIPLADVLSLREMGVSFARIDDEGRIAEEERLGVAIGSTSPVKPPAGRPRGRGLGSLLDCWMDCHALHKHFLTVNAFYAQVAVYLEHNPSLVGSVPAVARFAALRYNGKLLRRDEKGCAWHQHDSAPTASHLLSYKP